MRELEREWERKSERERERESEKKERVREWKKKILSLHNINDNKKEVLSS